MEKRNRKTAGYDNPYFGAFLGLTFPIIAFLLFWVYEFSDQYSLSEYYDTLFNKSQMSAVLSLSVLANLPVFFLNLWNQRYGNVKGILGATFLYGALIILFKFF
ncbi:MAG: hypothetical protein H0W62_07550 [Chitinophagales bacterium]|nr:hypothetical protein [Chitinophagales bacterium]